mgnify:CR=1 FL=1
MNNNNDRSWNDNFKAYTEYIVNHKNYAGLPYERGKNGCVKWVVAGESKQGIARTNWWNEKCKQHDIPIQKGCYAIIARLLHPTKMHTCQCCGKQLSIYAVYPSKLLLTKLKKDYDINVEQTSCTIMEIVQHHFNTEKDLKYIAALFGVTSYANKTDLIEQIKRLAQSEQSKYLSPGVMSNCPDRFDGFHSDGLCCRERTDKGRHKDNMQTYTQDRRAYEEWADGNYNLANRLMGEFHKCTVRYECPVCKQMAQMSPDHIGPISLGFCHSTNFAPMCASCNSAKNNRFTLSDVKKLIQLENNGQTVVSWHAKYIWDKCKFNVNSDDDAKKLSSIMAKCHQNILKLFSVISEKGGNELLMQYLHPEYSLYDYRFKNFNPMKLEELQIIEKPLTSKNKRKNQERYIRIAFESLRDFSKKDNRKVLFYTDRKDIQEQTDQIIGLLNDKKMSEAKAKLNDTIEKLCDYVENGD